MYEIATNDDLTGSKLAKTILVLVVLQSHVNAYLKKTATVVEEHLANQINGLNFEFN